VLILDEPTAAVDPIASFELLTLIQEIARERKLAVLISSHRLDEVELLDDKVVLLNKGQVIYSGDLDAMLARSKRPVIEIEFDGEESAEKGLALLEGLAGIDGVDVEGPRVVLNTKLPMGLIIREIDAHVDHIHSIGVTQPRLREVLRNMLRVTVEEEE
jgi:ABC-2 type transport system ATP-binding protein